MSVRHFLSLLDLQPEEHRQLLDRAHALKRIQAQGKIFEPLKNKTLALVFEKSSTRTRVSFEAAITQFGGNALFLAPRDTQLGRGEPIEDTARVLSRMVDCVVMRTYAHETLERFATYAEVPVINALTDLYHPCQLLADIQTFEEHRGSIAKKNVCWVGDGNNMCHSYLNASRCYDFNLTIACPTNFQPNVDILRGASNHAQLSDDPKKAARDADLLVTDVWASMGHEDQVARRKQAFSGFQINQDVLTQAKPEALFMHCLPAHRGEEVSASVIDGPQSVVWDEAENRLHAQKALLEFLLQ